MYQSMLLFFNLWKKDSMRVCAGQYCAVICLLSVKKKLYSYSFADFFKEMEMGSGSKMFCLALQIPKKKYTAYEVIFILFEGENC